KPSNCFLVDDPLRPDRIKVVDFGVARMELSAHPVELESSDLKPVVGTSAYLAPERWLGEPADARSDLYAVGIMTYELLLGLRPFRGANIESQHAGQEPQSPRSRMPAAGIPGWLNAFVMRLLNKNPADRFASAQAALVHLLDKTQGAGFDFDPAAGSLTAPVASRSRLGWIAAGVLAGALAVVALVAIAARLPNTSQPRGVQGEQARE
ncbi:MAG: protein kinase domain-containing protein, partial [Nannocystaceae bacterium]